MPAAHDLERAARYHHPMEDVWAAVLDISGYPKWRSDLAGLERQPDLRGHEVWREVPRSGAPVTYETVETLKERRLVRCVVDQAGPFGGCVTAEIIRRDDGAIVTLAERLTVHSNWFRFTHTVAGRREALDAWLTDLGHVFGEEPVIANLPKDLRDPPKAAAAPEAADDVGSGVLADPTPAPAVAPAAAPGATPRTTATPPTPRAPPSGK